MSDSESTDSLSQCYTPELQYESATPLDNSQLTDTEQPILSRVGEGVRFEELLESKMGAPEAKQAHTASNKPKRKFLKKGEGIARFTPTAAKLRTKQMLAKQTSSLQPMKRKVANDMSTKLTRKPLHKRIPQIVQSSAPIERRQNMAPSPIPYTPPSHMHAATNSSHFVTPSLSSELTPKHISFQSADDQLSPESEYLTSDLARVPSDDSVVLVLMENEQQQQEDQREFEALEALVEAQLHGEASFDLDTNSLMDSPKFHALGRKAQPYLVKRNNSIPDMHVNSPLSTANSSGFQNPLNNARAGDDGEWDEFLRDEIEAQESWRQYPDVEDTEELDFHEDSVLSSKREEPQMKLQIEKEKDSCVSNLIQERVQELENEITEYQRLNAAMRRQEREREREQSEFKQKLDEFEEYRKSELDRMEKDYQSQMSVVKRERQRLEQYKQTYHSSEAKLLKQEIEVLREQLAEAQDALRDKETKNRTLVQRLKNNLRQVEFERDELKNQIELMESLRLKQWEESAVQSSAKQPARTKLKFDRVPSEEDLTKYEYDREPTELFSESSASIESDNNEENEMSTIENTSLLNETKYSDGAIKSYANSTAIPGFVDKLSERVLADNSTEITYFNNTRKVISPNGKLVTLYLSNGDIKTTTADKTVYFYAENSTKYTKLKNGQEIYEYSTGQRETNRPDGSKEIIFPDGNTAYIFPDGSEKITCKDGTVQKKSADASTTVIWHPDGFVDTLTKEFKKREFANGTCKIVFRDGKTETRYPGGRVRIKTAEGRVTFDGIIDK